MLSSRSSPASAEIRPSNKARALWPVSTRQESLASARERIAETVTPRSPGGAAAPARWSVI